MAETSGQDDDNITPDDEDRQIEKEVGEWEWSPSPSGVASARRKRPLKDLPDDKSVYRRDVFAY